MNLEIRIPSEVEVAPRYKQLTLMTLLTLFINTIETALHCYNISMYACIYC